MAKEHSDSEEPGGDAPSGRCRCCQPSHEEIAKRASDLWLVRGMMQGHDVDDWLNVECELRQARHGQRHGVAA